MTEAWIKVRAFMALPRRRIAIVVPLERAAEKAFSQVTLDLLHRTDGPSRDAVAEAFADAVLRWCRKPGGLGDLLGCECKWQEIPEGAVPAGISFDMAKAQIVLYVDHPSFDVIPEGGQPREFRVRP